MNATLQNPRRPGCAARTLLVVLALVLVAGALALLLRRRASSPLGAAAAKPTTAAPSAASPKAAPRSSTTPERSSLLQPGASVFSAQLLTLTNAAIPLGQRHKVAEALAENGSEPALAVLKQAFAAGPENLRVAIAESLGRCASPECADWLQALLQDSDTQVARGAARALSTQDTPESAGALVRLLGDPNTDPELRLEVAASLGSLTQPGVLQALADAARTTEDPDLAQAVLNALGQRDFAETESFFKEYLQTPGLSSELRVAAVEALAQAQGDPNALLLSLAADPDAEVRAAAAWALSTTDSTGTAGAQILSLLGKETDPDVRLRLYQALGNQEGFDSAAALAMVQQETNPSARVAGLDLLAKLLRDNPTAPLQTYFNTTGIAELKQIALSGQNYDDRQTAILALTRAHTPEAMAALNQLTGQLNLQPAPQKH